ASPLEDHAVPLDRERPPIELTVVGVDLPTPPVQNDDTSLPFGPCLTTATSLQAWPPTGNWPTKEPAVPSAVTGGAAMTHVQVDRTVAVSCPPAYAARNREIRNADSASVAPTLPTATIL